MPGGNGYVAGLLFVALGLAACGIREWHLTAAKNGKGVELCLSESEQCPLPGGISPSSISVYQWDNMHDNHLVWDIEPSNPVTDENISGVITYGEPPRGWVTHVVPSPIICGKAYLVNPGAHYFALKCDGTVTVFEAPKLEEFFRANHSATPVKGDPKSDTMGPE
jgi:hypothetical protein